MVYPEKPFTKKSWRLGGKHSRGKFSGKFRLGSRDATNYWQENLEQWEKDEDDYSPETSPRHSREKRSIPSHNGGSGKRTDSRFSESIDSSINAGSSRDFVHHVGFQGSEPAKLKVGKKTSKYSSKSDSAVPSQNTFRPKGFGSLYDELEFQRRYKKVFDVNNHIHFVHSNYVSGHKISKRTKLPPIGYVPGLQADTQENLDIFAIMSVQKYNHPEEEVHAARTTPGIQPSPRKENDSNGIQVPPGFIPSPAKSYSKSPFHGIKGSPPHNITPRSSNMYRLPSLSRDESEDHFGQNSGDSDQNQSGTDNTTLSDRSHRSKKGKKTKLTDTARLKRDATKKKRLKNETAQVVNDDTDNLTEDMEPFTFSVKVEIKPKEQTLHTETSTEVEESNGNSENDKGTVDINEDSVRQFEGSHGYQNLKNRIIYPSQIYNDTDNEHYLNGDKIVTPRNISVTKNEFGIISKRIQYPERFYIENSLAEVDESKLSESEAEHLNVPSTPDSNRPLERTNGRNISNLSSGNGSIPEIRTTCPTPNPAVDSDDT